MHSRRLILTTLALVSVALAAPALAQSSLGIGAAEQPMTNAGNGPLANFFAWVAMQQREFYRLMTNALGDMRDNPAAAWVLIWLSFLYGILHAAGPGHGKVVISSYMLATDTQLKRGVAISLAASLLQATSAIVIVGVGFMLLRQVSVSVTDTTRGFEIASYAMVTALGAWLVIRSIMRIRHRPLVSLSAAVVDHAHAHGHGHRHGHDHDHHHHNHSHDGRHSHGHDDHGHGHDHHHHDGEVCSSCGHAHMPSASKMSDIEGLREAMAAVFSVGLRPCTGALVVLTFAFMNGLWWAGLASTFAMSIGTAITVSTLAAIAVGAKGLAKRYAGASEFGPAALATVEVVGGLLILAIGVTLLGGATAP